jgi:CheY-like chemotaxis protein
MSRILVVDDDATQLELRKVVLEASGFEVVLAIQPSGALEQLQRGCDLVMMDLRFVNRAGVPDPQEGLALIRGIRQLNARVPVLVLAGWPDDIHGTPEARMVSQVMMKPVPTRDLLSAIAGLTGVSAAASKNPSGGSLRGGRNAPR